MKVRELGNATYDVDVDTQTEYSLSSASSKDGRAEEEDTLLSIEDSLRDVQAKHSALNFLCSINVDHRDVTKFLRTYPDALLLEGTDSSHDARTVVCERMNSCECFAPVCNQNRRHLLKVLSQGFEFFRSEEAPSNDTARVLIEKKWDEFAHQLKDVESKLRRVELRERDVSSRLMSIQLNVQTYQYELGQISRSSSSLRGSGLRLLACRKVDRRAENLRSEIENSYVLALLSRSSLEREKAMIAQDFLSLRKTQFTLFKSAFGSFSRHVCHSNKAGEI